MAGRTKTPGAREVEARLAPVRVGEPLLCLRDVTVTVRSRRGDYPVVHGVSLDVRAGEILGVVGESGCGKSVTMSAAMGLLPSNLEVSGGAIDFRGLDLRTAGEPVLEQLRGGDLSMVFQDPMTALDPLYTVGSQILEAIRLHSDLRGEAARELAVDYLRRVGLSEPERRMGQYPFELSGGMRQRVVIAIALCCSPSLLICDEPTTALDVTIQAKVLDLVRELHGQLGNSVVFISHNMGVIASVCDRVAVMYGGHVVERGTVDEIFYATAHPYTRGLLACMPTLTGPREEPLVPIAGMVPDPRRLGEGCPFAARCPRCMRVCRRAMPPELALGGQHSCACWLCVSEGAGAGAGATAATGDETPGAGALACDPAGAATSGPTEGDSREGSHA